MRPSAVRPPAVFLQQKTTSANKIMRIYYKIGMLMCFSQKTSVVRPSAGRPSAVYKTRTKFSKNLIMRIYKKKVHLCVFLRKLVKHAPLVRNVAAHVVYFACHRLAYVI